MVRNLKSRRSVECCSVNRSSNKRTIVIVGGTTGLGLSAARALVADGTNVIVVGRNADSGEAAVAQLGNGSRFLVADATDPECAVQAIREALDVFGSFDGLYHVAGGSGRAFGDGPVHELSDEAIEETMGLNFTSLVYSNRAAIRAFLAQQTGGVILNMGSVLASSPAPAYFATSMYASAKAAVVGFTKSAAAFYARDSIRVNVVAPALVETPMSRRAADNDEIKNYISTKQPLDGGRIGQPQDLDDAVVFLLSDRSRFVTGQVFTIDGGWSISEGRVADE